MGMMEFRRFECTLDWISAATKHGISFHVASAMYETICYALSGRVRFYLHHVVTIGCCSSMLLTGCAHFGAACLGLWRIQRTIMLLHVFGRIPALKASILYVANGALLWIACLCAAHTAAIPAWKGSVLQYEGPGRPRMGRGR